MIEDILTPYISPRFASEEKYRLGHIRVINPLPGQKVLGLHIPDMKKIAAGLAASGECLSIIRGFENVRIECRDFNEPSLCIEEKIIWGLMLDRLKVPLETRLEMFGRFVPAIDNWAVCDTVCCDAKWAVAKKNATGRTGLSGQERERLWKWLGRYYRSDREFEVRFAVVMSMCHFLEKGWLPYIFSAIKTLDFNNIHSDYPETAVKGVSPYYLRMGTAWLLATSLAKYPEETRRFINGSKLPENVIRLYVRKARESFRTRNTPPL